MCAPYERYASVSKTHSARISDVRMYGHDEATGERRKNAKTKKMSNIGTLLRVCRSIQFSQLISETSSSEKREERMNKDMQLTTVDHQLLLRQRIYVDVNFSIEKALTSSTLISSHQHSFMAIKSTSIQLIRLCWCYCCFTPLTHSIAQPH